MAAVLGSERAARVHRLTVGKSVGGMWRNGPLKRTILATRTGCARHMLWSRRIYLCTAKHNPQGTGK